MKIFVLSIFILITASVHLYSDYRYVERVVSPEASYFYDLNKHDEISYIGNDELGKLQVFVYSGNIIEQITESLPYNYYYYNIDMNDNQEIVWFSTESDSEGKYKNYIKYKGTGGIKIIYEFTYVNLNNYPAPRINNKGYITWSYPLAYGLQPEIFLWDTKEVRTITQDNNPDYAPSINNNFVTWFGDNRNNNDWDYSVKYYNFLTKEISAIPIKKGAYPLIDEDNNIVFSINSGNISELKLFKNNNITNISSNLYHQSYAISGGKIAWVDENLRVHLFDNGSDIIVSPDGQKCYLPAVNSNAWVTWQDETKNAWLRKGSEVYDLAFSDNCHSSPIINDNGIIVWRGADIDYYGATLYSAQYINVFDVEGQIIQTNSNKGNDDIILSSGLKDVLVTDGINKTLTDEDGNFKLKNIEIGETTIKFMKDGFVFQPSEITVEIKDQHIKIQTPVIASIQTGIEEEVSLNELVISPNPATDYININSNSSLKYSSDKSIILYDILGNAILKLDSLSDKTLKINLSELSSGYYFLRVGSKTGKFIKK